MDFFCLNIPIISRLLLSMVAIAGRFFIIDWAGLVDSILPSGRSDYSIKASVETNASLWAVSIVRLLGMS